MASDSGTRAINGNYGSTNSYGSADQQSSTYGLGAGSAGSANPSTGAEAPSAPHASTGASAPSTEGSSSVPKDEVGWYFVEQYYTTLSKNPEKLHVSPNPALPLRKPIGSHPFSFSTTSALSSSQEWKPKRFLYPLDSAYVNDGKARICRTDYITGNQRTHQGA